MQSRDELEDWHKEQDPWKYEQNTDDRLRKSVLLSELPQRAYKSTLDIGCGQGFVTRDLPGETVLGVDISEEAVIKARKWKSERLDFCQASLFDLPNRIEGNFDLIILTGVLYPQYVGHALNLVYDVIDGVLADNGILVSVHIDEWYTARFPYLMLKEYYYDYREYTHRLEVYVK